MQCGLIARFPDRQDSRTTFGCQAGTWDGWREAQGTKGPGKKMREQAAESLCQPEFACYAGVPKVQRAGRVVMIKRVGVKFRDSILLKGRQESTSRHGWIARKERSGFTNGNDGCCCPPRKVGLALVVRRQAQQPRQARQEAGQAQSRQGRSGTGD